MNKNKKQHCRVSIPELSKRPLIDKNQALSLEMTFKVLANATRLRLLHAIARSGKLCVSELAEALDMKPTAVSNQLQRLADRGIVKFHRKGLQIYYEILDPCTVPLLDYAWCLTECSDVRTSGNISSKTAKK